MSKYDEKAKLGLQRWHRPSKGDIRTYVDVYDFADNMDIQDVLLATYDETGGKGPVLSELTADDAEMLGLRLIAAARMYREQERKEADDE